MQRLNARVRRGVRLGKIRAYDKERRRQGQTRAVERAARVR